MVDFKLTPEEYGLVRMGRKRSIVLTFYRPINGLGSGVILNTVTSQSLQVEVVRFSVTHLQDLTQEDAVKAGYMYLHQLTTALADSPSVMGYTPVSIFEFRCDGDPE
ncbi:MAG: hypothetical protein V3T08_09990 [Gemmatimonadota bacterium]